MFIPETPQIVHCSIPHILPHFEKSVPRRQFFIKCSLHCNHLDVSWPTAHFLRLCTWFPPTSAPYVPSPAHDQNTRTSPLRSKVAVVTTSSSPSSSSSYCWLSVGEDWYSPVIVVECPGQLTARTAPKNQRLLRIVWGWPYKGHLLRNGVTNEWLMNDMIWHIQPYETCMLQCNVSKWNYLTSPPLTPQHHRCSYRYSYQTEDQNKNLSLLLRISQVLFPSHFGWLCLFLLDNAFGFQMKFPVDCQIIFHPLAPLLNSQQFWNRYSNQ